MNCESRVLFNPCFEQINQFQGRYRIIYGGAGSGKSFNLAQDYLIKLMDTRYQGANLLIVRKTASSHYDSTYAELLAAARRICGDRWEEYFSFSVNPLKVHCRSTGNQVLFRGMKDIVQRERIKSLSCRQGKICWIWCEEATELEDGDLETLDDRLRGILPKGLFYQITLSFNPVHAGHWIRKRFFDVMNDDIMIHHSTYLDNQFIDQGFYRRMAERASRDPEGYRIYGLGEWGQKNGLIISHYEVCDFCTQDRFFDAMALGTDFGFNHPHATVLLGWKDGKVFVCDELILYGKTMQEILDALEVQFGKNLLMWCDSAEPDRIAAIRNAGWNARAVSKGPGSVFSQIDWLKQHPIIIHPRCTHTIQEIQQWEWKKDPVTGEYLDRPNELHDDAIAAIRYGIEGWRKVRKVLFE